MNRSAAVRALAVGLAVLASACSSAAAPPYPEQAADFALVNRLTWGATAADMTAIRQLHRDGWIDSQLRAGTRLSLPAAVQVRFDAMPIAAKPLGEIVVGLDAMRKASVDATDQAEKQRLRFEYGAALKDYARQTIDRSFLRDLYSPDQLREQLTWFWFNHFNVRIGNGLAAAMVDDYVENTIRPRALGHFCELAGATLRHPVMLLYLNNAASASGKINENYARELLELHTMGVGSGYTQKDVQQLARVLTGATVDVSVWPPPPAPKGGERNGLYVFDPARHDGGAKTILGHHIAAKGPAEIDEALGIICHQPATATRISRKLAQYFVADDPPPALVARMAATFAKTDGDIAAVLRTMITAPEFTTSLGTLYKDPEHYILSAARLAFDGRTAVTGVPLSTMTAILGQPRFSRLTPDGYPLEAANWNASGQLDARFSAARRIGTGKIRDMFSEAGDPPDLESHLAETAIYPGLAPATRAALAEAKDRREWNALFLSSPEFMRR